MGFYEDDRIRRKQRKYLIQEAGKKIDAFKLKGITGARLLNLLKNKSVDTSLNESEREIYTMATQILEVQ